MLGTRDDPHVDRVVSLLEGSGVDVRILDYRSDVKIDVHLDGAGVTTVHVDGVELPKHVLVWNRNKLVQAGGFGIDGEGRSADFRMKEWRAIYHVIESHMAGRVVNPLEVRALQNKPYQQAIAARSGFLVPETLISNSKESALTFVSGHGRAILKSLSGATVQPRSDEESRPYHVMTMRVSVADLEGIGAESLAACPHFLQREVAKAYELRVVVAGSELLGFRIDAQQHAVTEVDWRKAYGLVGFSRTELDSVVTKRVRSFMEKSGLICGSLDIIVDAGGDYWFLECNQDGQWAWLDDIAEGAVAKAYADTLRCLLRTEGRLSSSSTEIVR